MIDYKHISNITDLISIQAYRQPNTIAIHTDSKTLTYQALDNLVWKVSTFLHQRGIKQGDIVALTITDKLSLLLMMLGVSRIGATLFLAPYQIRHKNYSELLQTVKADILITEQSNTYNALPVIFVNDIHLKQINIDYTVRDHSPKAPYIVISGSGSTGKSKMMPITHHNDIKKVQLSVQWLPDSNDNRIVSLSSLYYYSSLIVYLRAFNRGASIVLQPQEMHPLDTYRQFNVTVMFASVFNIYQILQKASNDRKSMMTGLNMLYITGSTVSNDLRQKIIRYISKQLFIAYGTNECSTATLLTPSMLTHTKNSLGFPLKGVEVEIVSKKGFSLPYGEVGFIKIKSPAMINSYLDDTKATSNAFKDGWFYPGDLGKFTKDGQLIYMGRSDNMMIMNGINIYPAEIEQALMAHPAVMDAVAFPLSSHIHQHIPVCAVVLKKEMSVSNKELLDYAFQDLAVKSPKKVIIITTIPRTEQGKVIRKQLKALVLEKLL